MQLLELSHLIYPKLSTGCGTLVFFTNVTLIEFQIGYSALFCLFSVTDGFRWFWLVSLRKRILHSRSYTFPTIYPLLTFLVMLSVILLSMLMILLSTLSVIRYLICDNNWDTVDWGGKQLVYFNARKTRLVSFDQSNKSHAIDVKWMVLWHFFSPSLLNCRNGYVGLLVLHLLPLMNPWLAV